MTMKKVYLLRSAKYDYLLPGMDLYDSFNVVARKEIIPDFTETKDEFLQRLPKELLSVNKIFTSSDERCIKTGAFFQKEMQVLPLLDEIKYDMTNFIHKEDFFKNGSAQVDKARVLFVNALLEDHLFEHYESVIARIEKFIQVIDEEKEDIICISHGFILRVIEAYLQDGTVGNKRVLLRKYFSGQKESYQFGKGLMVTYNNNLRVVSYF